MIQRGYILIPVMLALAVLAAVAFAVARESGMETREDGDAYRALRAAYAAEAGFSHALWKLRRSTPPYSALAATAFDGGSYTVAVAPLTGSPITLTASATRPDGSGHVWSRQVSLTNCNAQQSVELQPGAEGTDTHIRADQSDRNYGASNALRVEAESGKQAHVLLRFDLAAIPADATVTNAQLSLYATSINSGGTIVEVYRVTRAWVEGSGTGGGGSGASAATWTSYDGVNPWTTAGGDHGVTVHSSKAVTVADQTHDFTLTNLVQQWLSASAANYGVLLRPKNVGAAGTVDFASGDHATAAWRPKLVVAYKLACL